MGIFGSISKALFGKQKPATSGNQFSGQINEQFSPWVSQGTAGMGQYANVLGLGGADAQQGALQDWWNSSGGQFQLNQGLDQIAGNSAAGGLLRSGGTAKAMENYRSNLASTKLNEYLGNLSGFNNQALQAGQLISGAGQTQTGASTKGGGLGKAIGLAASVFSDRRAKTDIKRIGEERDGLGRYRFRYLWNNTPQTGVMADEVARLRPWALGPEIGGFMTVRYDLLEAA